MASNFVPATDPSQSPGGHSPQGAIATYEQAVEFLYSRINYERTGHAPYTADHYRLDRMRRLLRELGDPQGAYPIVHVAGTKGKGTVCHLLAAALQASGYRTGLYTSPHLHRVEERFVVNGEPPGGSELAALTGQVAQAAGRVESAGAGRPTFFELTTAHGFLLFARRTVDVAVLEVGLGGRLDSTNVCQPICCAITSISLDHQRQLGDSIAEIAAEKAGIIKPGVPVICAARHPDAVRTILSVAERRGAPAMCIGRDFRADWHPVGFVGDRDLPAAQVRVWSDQAGWPGPCVRPRDAAADGKLRGAAEAAGGGGDQVDRSDAIVRGTPASQRPDDAWPVRLLGEHQADNVAVAVTVLNVLARQGWRIDWDRVRQAVRRVQPPGRLQVVCTRPLAVVDTAHNPASIAAGLKALETHFLAPPQSSATRRIVALFAVSRDKDYRAMLGALMPRCEHLVLTEYQQHPRALPLDQLGAAAQELMREASPGRSTSAPLPVHAIAAPLEAWHRAIALAGAEGLVYACGSFFLAAELLAAALPR